MDSKTQAKLKALNPVGVRNTQEFLEARIADLHKQLEGAKTWEDARLIQGRIQELRHFSSTLAHLDDIEETIRAKSD